tara:strand:+ start:768 stop:1019 length:252 start_codon:yes stop_codon:yes gene_type:complete
MTISEKTKAASFLGIMAVLALIAICALAIDARMNTPQSVATEIINSCEEVDSDCFKECFKRDLTTARICVEMYNTIQKEEAYG